MFERVSDTPEMAVSELGANRWIVIKMITGRLGAVRKKKQMIAEANSHVQHAYQQAPRRRSGDVTPRSVPSHASS